MTSCSLDPGGSSWPRGFLGLGGLRLSAEASYLFWCIFVFSFSVQLFLSLLVSRMEVQKEYSVFCTCTVIVLLYRDMRWRRCVSSSSRGERIAAVVGLSIWYVCLPG